MPTPESPPPLSQACGGQVAVCVQLPPVEEGFLFIHMSVYIKSEGLKKTPFSSIRVLNLRSEQHSPGVNT